MKEIVCLQVYKGVLEATLFSTEAGQEKREPGAFQTPSAVSGLGWNLTKSWGEICAGQAEQGSIRLLLWRLILNYSSWENEH